MDLREPVKKGLDKVLSGSKEQQGDTADSEQSVERHSRTVLLGVGAVSTAAMLGEIFRRVHNKKGDE